MKSKLVLALATLLLTAFAYAGNEPAKPEKGCCKEKAKEEQCCKDKAQKCEKCKEKAAKEAKECCQGKDQKCEKCKEKAKTTECPKSAETAEK